MPPRTHKQTVLKQKWYYICGDDVKIDNMDMSHLYSIVKLYKQTIKHAIIDGITTYTLLTINWY